MSMTIQQIITIWTAYTSYEYYRNVMRSTILYDAGPFIVFADFNYGKKNLTW